jgi:hypothetical protein
MNSICPDCGELVSDGCLCPAPAEAEAAYLLDRIGDPFTTPAIAEAYRARLAELGDDDSLSWLADGWHAH